MAKKWGVDRILREGEQAAILRPKTVRKGARGAAANNAHKVAARGATCRVGQPDVLARVTDVLEEATHFWRAALESYNDPKLFRANLNALLQAVRNVTFRLQSSKDDVENFDAWYRPWQAYMKASKHMSWSNSARTEVVHKRGLDSKSTALVRIFHSYTAPLAAKFEVSPALPNYHIATTIARTLPDEMRKHAIVEVERCWRVDGGPDEEILTSVAECLRVLLALRSSLITLLKAGSSELPSVVVDSTPMPPSLTVSPEYFVARLLAATGEPLVHEQRRIDYDPKRNEEVIRRYGTEGLVGRVEPGDDPVAFAEALLPVAMRTLAVDRYHVPILWVHKSTGWELRVLAFAGREEKWWMWHHMAEEAAKAGVDAIVYICEVWVGTAEQGKRRAPPSEEENNGEGLQVYAETSGGTLRNIFVPFERRDDGITFGQVVRDDTTLAGFTAPLRTKWLEREGSEP